MANFFGEVYGQFGSVWKKLSAGQKIVIVLVSVSMMVGIGGLVYWSSQIEMSLLYGGIAQEDAGEIQARLDEWGVVYELKGGGTIHVPRERVLELRNRLSLEGLPKGDGQGMEIFDEMQLGMTEFLQKVNLTRAKQTELKRTISWLEQVASCRVHIVEPKPTIFSELERTPTAVVVLRLVPGRSMSVREVMGITNIVAAAVEGLDAENVKVVDGKGRLLSKPPGDGDHLMASGQLELKQNYEKVMTRKVQDRLDRVVGPDRVNVAVNLDLDIQKETRTREKRYSQPDEGKIVMEEKTVTEDTTESTPAVGGATGTESKLAGEPAVGQPGKTNKEDVDRKYAVNEEEMDKIEGGVTIKRMTLAIMIDEALALDDQGAVDAAKKVELQANIEGIVKNAVGYDETRDGADGCKTVFIPFSPPETLEDADTLASYEQKEFILTIAKYGIQGLSVAGVILILFIILRRAEKKVTAVVKELPESARSLSDERERVERKRGREEVVTAVQADPIMASEILHEWLKEEG